MSQPLFRQFVAAYGRPTERANSAGTSHGPVTNLSPWVTEGTKLDTTECWARVDATTPPFDIGHPVLKPLVYSRIRPNENIPRCEQRCMGRQGVPGEFRYGPCLNGPFSGHSRKKKHLNSRSMGADMSASLSILYGLGSSKPHARPRKHKL